MEKLKVLVVDDEARMRKLVKDFLQRQDYLVIEAENGEQAVDIFFEEKDIALILLDVMMPKMDGWQVTREIRQFSKVPIIMLTARADERDELLGFELGVDEYISKPFSPKILVARVNAVLRRSGKGDTEDVLESAWISPRIRSPWTESRSISPSRSSSFCSTSLKIRASRSPAKRF